MAVPGATKPLSRVFTYPYEPGGTVFSVQPIRNSERTRSPTSAVVSVWGKIGLAKVGRKLAPGVESVSGACVCKG